MGCFMSRAALRVKIGVAGLIGGRGGGRKRNWRGGTGALVLLGVERRGVVGGEIGRWRMAWGMGSGGAGFGG